MTLWEYFKSFWTGTQPVSGPTDYATELADHLLPRYQQIAPTTPTAPYITPRASRYQGKGL